MLMDLQKNLQKTSIWKDNPILFFSLIEDSYDQFVKKMYDYNSLINVTNIYGESLLHYCSYYGIIDKYYALVNSGAIVNQTYLGNNLLHYASISGKDDFLIVELVKLGISPIEKNLDGQTSLHFCANERIAHYFNIWSLRNNIKVSRILDNDANTVAHGCKSFGHLDAARYWVNNHPQLNDKENIYKKTWMQIKKKTMHYCTF